MTCLPAILQMELFKLLLGHCLSLPPVGPAMLGCMQSEIYHTKDGFDMILFTKP